MTGQDHQPALDAARSRGDVRAYLTILDDLVRTRGPKARPHHEEQQAKHDWWIAVATHHAFAELRARLAASTAP